VSEKKPTSLPVLFVFQIGVILYEKNTSKDFPHGRRTSQRSKHRPGSHSLLVYCLVDEQPWRTIAEINPVDLLTKVCGLYWQEGRTVFIYFFGPARWDPIRLG
jgi:hypothetical protein